MPATERRKQPRSVAFHPRLAELIDRLRYRGGVVAKETSSDLRALRRTRCTAAKAGRLVMTSSRTAFGTAVPSSQYEISA